MKPELIVVSGPNAADKSSLIDKNKFNTLAGFVIIQPDITKADTLKLIDKALAENRNICS